MDFLYINGVYFPIKILKSRLLPWPLLRGERSQKPDQTGLNPKCRGLGRPVLSRLELYKDVSCLGMENRLRG